MKVSQSHTNRAFTIVEALIAITILVITIIGTSIYRYQAVFGVRKADLYSTAVRTALLLCEGWAGADGSSVYNPVTTFSPQLNISTSTGLAAPTGYTKLNSYKIIEDGVAYFATLSWKDIGTEGVRALHVVVKWDSRNRGINTLASAEQSYQISTYIRK